VWKGMEWVSGRTTRVQESARTEMCVTFFEPSTPSSRRVILLLLISSILCSRPSTAMFAALSRTARATLASRSASQASATPRVLLTRPRPQAGFRAAAAPAVGASAAFAASSPRRSPTAPLLATPPPVASPIADAKRRVSTAATGLGGGGSGMDDQKKS
jgi:hypothetical protein